MPNLETDRDATGLFYTEVDGWRDRTKDAR